MKAITLLLLLILAFLLLAEAKEVRRDPQTGRIRVLYLGDCIVQENPSLAFIPEPWTEVTRIPASLHWKDAHEAFIGESVAKFMRRYMARTYGDLLANYDVIILSDANVLMFQLHHLQWFSRSVEEEGLGLTMVGGDETFGGYGGHVSWGPTEVGRILPVSCIDGKNPRGGGFFVRVEIPDHPLLRSLPLSESPFPPFGGVSATITRHGADQLARLETVVSRWPFLVEWEWGAGGVFAFTSDWTGGHGGLFTQWDYYDDFSINLMLHLAGLEIPQERELLHQVRAKSREYSMNRMFLYAMIDFIEKFGAQTVPVERGILEAEEVKSEADRLYMEIDLPGALARIEAALGRLRDADALAARMKDSALFHVYLIEWLAVTGVSLLAGSILYELMIRRRMFREIGTTRFEG